MKYIDAEKLKEDIQANLAAISFNDDYQEGYEACGMSVLKSIDSLQQEQQDDKLTNIAYWLEYFGMPKENIEKCTTQISQGYGAIRYLEGVQVGAEAVNELAEQEQPEQPTRGYDEAYLNEKIAKATKSWKGVDVDKFMDDMRGREPEVDLEKEYKEYVEDDPVFSILTNRNVGFAIAKHFYKLGKNSK